MDTKCLRLDINKVAINFCRMMACYACINKMTSKKQNELFASIIIFCIAIVTALISSHAETYDQSFLNSREVHEHNIVVSHGTNTYKVTGVPKGGVYPFTPGSRTEWHVNGEYNNTFNSYISDPTFNYGQISGNFNISAIVYGENWVWLETHTWQVHVVHRLEYTRIEGSRVYWQEVVLGSEEVIYQYQYTADYFDDLNWGNLYVSKSNEILLTQIKDGLSFAFRVRYITNSGILSEWLTAAIIFINNIENLQKIGNDEKYPLNGYYLLTQDIDATETAFWNDGIGFIPIGKLGIRWDAPDKSFTGTLDGQGHTIHGITIGRESYHNDDIAALFRTIGADSIIRNLHIEGCDIAGGSGSSMAGLVGVNEGTIIDCSVEGNIFGAGGSSSIGGGVVAFNTGTIKNCCASVNISSVFIAGGLVVFNYPSAMITNSYATGNVSADWYAGGLIASNYQGDVTRCYATGTVTGNGESGGLIGMNAGTVQECYAVGVVSASRNVGGLIGLDYMTARKEGIILKYAKTGRLDALSMYEEFGVTLKSFWDVETSGLTVSAGGSGRTTTQMMMKETFSDAEWDLDYTWGINEGISYPLFRSRPSLKPGLSTPTNQSPIPVLLLFSKSVIGVDSESLILNNATLHFFEVNSGYECNLMLLPIEDGPVTAYLPADVTFDANGIGNAESNRLSIIYDSTPPPKPQVYGPAYVNHQRPMWTWQSGGVDGIGVFRVGWEEGQWIVEELMAMTYAPDDELTPGTHTLYVQERDDAGNWSDAGSHTIIIDITPPDPPIITTDWGNGPGEDFITTSQAFLMEGTVALKTLAVHVNGSASGIIYDENTGVWQYQTELFLGDNIFHITALDAAGNESTATILTVQLLPGQRVYVSPLGNNETGTGQVDNPWKTIGHALYTVGPFASEYRTITIQLAEGVYEEPVRMRPHTIIQGVSREECVIQHYKQSDASHVVIEMAENSRIETCTVSLPGTGLLAITALINIADVNASLSNVTLDSRNNLNSIGVNVSGPNSSSGVIKDCLFRRMQYGIQAVDTGINITRNAFVDIRGDAVFIEPDTTKDATSATPILGLEEDESTGDNSFRNVSGYLVQNFSPEATYAQMNDWGLYDESAIGAKMTGDVVFVPFKGMILPATLVVTVVDANTRQPVTDAIVQLSPGGLRVTDNENGIYVFPAVPPNAYTLEVEAADYQRYTQPITLSAAEIKSVDVPLNPSGPQTAREGEEERSMEGELEGEGEEESDPLADGCGCGGTDDAMEKVRRLIEVFWLTGLTMAIIAKWGKSKRYQSG